MMRLRMKTKRSPECLMTQRSLLMPPALWLLSSDEHSTLGNLMKLHHPGEHLLLVPRHPLLLLRLPLSVHPSHHLLLGSLRLLLLNRLPTGHHQTLQLPLPGDPCRLSLVFTGVHHPVVAFPPSRSLAQLLRSSLTSLLPWYKPLPHIATSPPARPESLELPRRLTTTLTMLLALLHLHPLLPHPPHLLQLPLSLKPQLLDLPLAIVKEVPVDVDVLGGDQAWGYRSRWLASLKGHPSLFLFKCFLSCLPHHVDLKLTLFLDVIPVMAVPVRPLLLLHRLLSRRPHRRHLSFLFKCFLS